MTAKKKAAPRPTPKPSPLPKAPLAELPEKAAAKNLDECLDGLVEEAGCVPTAGLVFAFIPGEKDQDKGMVTWLNMPLQRFRMVFNTVLEKMLELATDQGRMDMQRQLLEEALKNVKGQPGPGAGPASPEIPTRTTREQRKAAAVGSVPQQTAIPLNRQARRAAAKRG